MSYTLDGTKEKLILSRPVPQAMISRQILSRYIFNFIVPSRRGTGRDGAGFVPRPAELWYGPSSRASKKNKLSFDN